jgi:hypothetical protein
LGATDRHLTCILRSSSGKPVRSPVSGIGVLIYIELRLHVGGGGVEA